MQCPYCLSDIEEAALVCKVCTKDLYLLKPMLAKIAALEAQVQALPDTDAFEERIRLLEQQLESAWVQAEPEPKRGLGSHLIALAAFILLPLCLLLLAHGLITVVYDTKLIYLRLISIVLPLPFGYFLFARNKRVVLPWFIGTCVLAVTSVIGMSWITSLVDQTPILPQNAFEWREYLEYAASISFSFLTGMLLGGVAYAHKHRRPTPITTGPLAKAMALGTSGKKLSPARLQQLMSVLNEYGSSAVALGSTALSIYTGLKSILGS